MILPSPTIMRSELEACIASQEDAAAAHWMATWKREGGALGRVAYYQDRAAHHAEQARDRLDRINGWAAR
jgi:hypothetical protein